tara:strand:+ start:2439 stop:2696 length:258 start_codon:yes stop_codon:yes gene_type:complete
MLQIISIGLVLIAYFKENKELRGHILLPIYIILFGIVIGVYSTYFTYFSEDKESDKIKVIDGWKFISIILCISLIYICVYVIKVL